MRKVIGWIAIALAGLVGAAASFGMLYLFAPHAPAFWLLIVLPLVLAMVLAFTISRYLARTFDLAAKAAIVLACILAVLPLAGLVLAMLVSPAQPRLASVDDPRGPHRTLMTPSGAKIAWWSFAPDKAARKTPVIFLHGGPGSFVRNRDFDIGRAFREVGFRTVFYDQAGSGASADLLIARYTVSNAVADLEALRVAVGAEKVILWGESWGASLAATYVRAHPDRVAATILESPGDFPGEPVALDYSKTDTKGGFKPTLRDATLYLLIGNAPQLSEAWQSQVIAREIAQARTVHTKHIFGYQCKGAKSSLLRPLSPGGSNLYPQLRLQMDLERLPIISKPLSSQPALLIRGGCDYIPSATSARYMRAFPNAQRVDVPGRGHGFFGHEEELRTILRGYAVTKLNQIP
ncbi:MAG: alpha/beta hydrolase [Sphingorhabdus sp.]